MKTKKLTFNAMFIALYVVLEMFCSIKMGNMKITFDALPIIVSAMLFGPSSGFFVGTLGSFTAQMLTFGVTLTTPLWIIPAGLRGLCIGLYAKKKNFKLSKLEFTSIVIITAIMVTILNTFSLYVDSKLYGYYSFAFVFGSLIARFVTGTIIAVIHSSLAPVLINILKKII